VEPDRTNPALDLPSTDLPVPGCVLALGAHPDDIEFGCGATLAKWAAAGAAVHLMVLTDGSRGSWDPAQDPIELAARRTREQTEAARVLRARRVHMLGAVDGELHNTEPAREAVCGVIRRVRPDIVLGHDPWKRYRLHPDHHEAGRLTIDAVVAARHPHYFPGQLTSDVAAHRPRTLLLFEAEIRDHVEDVGLHVDDKIEALLCHRSQWRSTMGIEEGSPEELFQRDAFVTLIRTRAREAGELAGFGAGEAFKRIEPI
jgi:LmbE family N-acetylglucosaminyl deacetylase